MRRWGKPCTLTHSQKLVHEEFKFPNKTNRAVDTLVGLAKKRGCSSVGAVGQFVLLVAAGDTVCRKFVAQPTTGTLGNINNWLIR